METQRPDWKRIELCSFFLRLLEDNLLDLKESNHDEHYEKDLSELNYFYSIVFNVAFFEYALAYAEVQKDSNKILKDYYKKKYGEGLFGGEDEKL